MNEHELLLRHAERWAAQKERAFEAGLVELALDLRATHDGLPANRWEAESVRHLMLVRWPAHGPAGVPDIAALVQSLDTFWRFLRSTGRMAGSSDEPKKLLAEAKAAAKKMPAACTDPHNFGATKGIVDFGREIGISLDEADSMEEMEERLQQIMDAWNAQPDDVRMSRPLGAGNAGSVMGRAFGDAANAMLETGDLPPGWQLPTTPRLDEDDEATFYPNDPKVSGPLARSSGLMRQVIALADFADGKELTATGVLRPAVAREAYEHLDLWAWESRARPYRKSSDTEAERKERALNGWRSAGDCLPLDRLWAVAVAMGLVDASGRRAVRVRAADPASDQDWVMSALLGGLAVLSRSRIPSDVKFILMTLFALAEPYGGGPMTMGELGELRWENEYAEFTGPSFDQVRFKEIASRSMAADIASFEDCGWWVQRKGRVELTPLGWDFALVLVRAMDEEWI
ncbi:MAG: hypothetical protein Q4F67_01305 [Propionibacteriaceae bacterium]|nr:hypothetical protein [Propionibacteriaceae bacterium]